MVASTDAEDDPAAGEDVRHGVVLGQPQGVPHGQDVESTAELYSLRILGKPEAEHHQVGDALVAFPLKVVLGHPQSVEVQLLQKLGQILGDVEYLDETFVGIPAVVGRSTGEANSFTFQDMSSVEGRE